MRFNAVRKNEGLREKIIDKLTDYYTNLSM